MQLQVLLKTLLKTLHPRWCGGYIIKIYGARWAVLRQRLRSSVWRGNEPLVTCQHNRALVQTGPLHSQAALRHVLAAVRAGGSIQRREGRAAAASWAASSA